MRILFVDNHPEFTAVVRSALLSKHEVVILPTVAAARVAAEASSFDIALVDYDLDDGKGDEFVRWARATFERLPIVAVSARADGNAAPVRAGADRVCAKAEFATIGSVLEAATSGPP
jgi:DNA-binding response OmpR family regulator